MKAYKVFNPDWTCRGFQFEVGEVYEEAVAPKLCSKGFHACVKLIDCFGYYDFNPSNKVAEVELFGDIDSHEDSDKVCSNKIAIVREISWFEVLEMVNLGKDNTGNRNTGNCNTGSRNTGNCNTGSRNTGSRNTGDWNTGNCNTGSRNTGDWNTGNCNTGNCNTGSRNTGNLNTGNLNTGSRNTGNLNTGDCNTGNCNTGSRNTGDWNTGNCNTGSRNTGDWNTISSETGFFNTADSGVINVFNKPCKKAVWKCANKPSWLYFNLTEWIYTEDMSEEDKKKHTEHKTTGGYLKKLDYKEAFLASFLKASKEEQAAVRQLPNFDEDVFFEISGIRLSDYGV